MLPTTSKEPVKDASDSPKTQLQELFDTILAASRKSTPRSSTEHSRSSTPSSSSSVNRQYSMQPTIRTLKAPLSIPRPTVDPPVTRRLGDANKRSVSLQFAMPSTADAIREAMDDESLFRPSSITRPPIARLPSMRDPHNPRLLSSLARSTLPSARLTTIPPPVHLPSGTSDDSGIILEQSPPTRTSIDTLRSLRDRGMGLPSPTTPQRSEFSTSALSRWWFQPENKATVDRLLDEEDQGRTAEVEQDKHRKKYLAPTHPVVFCHGLLGFDTVKVGPIYPLQVSHWRGIKEVLEANGVEVLITRVPATSSIEERAKVLENAVSEAYPGRSVHLIGHSMGGLDCRYLATHLKQRTFEVLSVTTLATPHRGSSFADLFIETIGRERLPSVVALLDLLPNGGGDGQAFESLTLESMKKFNKSTPDAEGVRYFSWGAEATPGLLDPFRWPHSVILEKEGANDGLVSVESAKWGTYLGTLEDVNHLDLIGWINNPRYKWAEWTGKEIKFKPATFYLGVTDYLAKAVEGQKRELETDDKDAVKLQPEAQGLPVSTTETIGHGVTIDGPQFIPDPSPTETAVNREGRNESQGSGSLKLAGISTTARPPPSPSLGSQQSSNNGDNDEESQVWQGESMIQTPPPAKEERRSSGAVEKKPDIPGVAIKEVEGSHV